MKLAVVFPRANRRAGVERIAWDLSNYLASRHDTTFVGIEMDERPANAANFHAVEDVMRGAHPLRFRRTAARALAALQPDITVTLGAVCPPGDVFWVQSVHRAFMERSAGPAVLGRQFPVWTRQLLPRHRILLLMERSYFGSTRPYHDPWHFTAGSRRRRRLLRGRRREDPDNAQRIRPHDL